MLPDFPDFLPLGLEHKELYNSLVAQYPPFSDIAFSTLHIWWNLDGQLKLSNLNHNLVILYHLPTDLRNSGYSLIGTERIDESLTTLFAYLHEHQQPAKLVHVPEFTVEKIQDKQGLVIGEELDYHEYVMRSQDLAQLEGHDHSRTRRKVGRFLREVEGRDLELKSLDLLTPEAAQQLKDSVAAWNLKFPRSNDPEDVEAQAIDRTLLNSLALDTQNLCLFVDGDLHGLVLYHQAIDGKHYIINHLKVDYSIPFIFDYLTNQVAKRAVENGVPFLNMEMDLGVEGLRQHKMGLRPVGFFKKYTVSAD